VSKQGSESGSGIESKRLDLDLIKKSPDIDQNKIATLATDKGKASYQF
jgi:hypothetical protein